MNLRTKLLLATTVIAAIAAGCATTEEKSNDEKMKETIETAETVDLLVGTYTGKGSEGIYRLAFDPASGKLTQPELVATTENPSFLALSQNGENVYAVNETTNGSVTAFAWNDDRSKLGLINTQPSQGDYPCYIQLNKAGSQLAIANYMTGNVLAFDLTESASLSDMPAVRQHSGSGPNTERQEGPHAHCSEYSPDGKYLYAVDLGIDQVVKYALEGDQIGDGSPAMVLDPGDGPRHLVFSPNGALAFVINELSSTIVSARVNAETGDLDRVAKVSTLAEGFEGESFCADIHISSDGKYLYGSNRGDNSIAVFEVSEDGQLTLLATESVRGNWPRNFALSPDEKFLLVANQRSDNITVFARDVQTGLLSFTGHELKLSQPVCLKF